MARRPEQYVERDLPRNQGELFALLWERQVELEKCRPVIDHAHHGRMQFPISAKSPFVTFTLGVMDDGTDYVRKQRIWPARAIFCNAACLAYRPASQGDSFLLLYLPTGVRLPPYEAEQLKTIFHMVLDIPEPDPERRVRSSFVSMLRMNDPYLGLMFGLRDFRPDVVGVSEPHGNLMLWQGTDGRDDTPDCDVLIYEDTSEHGTMTVSFP